MAGPPCPSRHHCTLRGARLAVPQQLPARPQEQVAHVALVLWGLAGPSSMGSGQGTAASAVTLTAALPGERQGPPAHWRLGTSGTSGPQVRAGVSRCCLWHRTEFLGRD